jgi:hypothetical protein
MNYPSLRGIPSVSPDKIENGLAGSLEIILKNAKFPYF